MSMKAEISGRLRTVRQGLFGDHGGPDLARKLNLPARTWYNYETGVTVPAEVLLSFIEQTGANPKWLLTGDGPKFRHESGDVPVGELSASDLIRRSLDRLAESEDGHSTDPSLDDFVPIELYALDQLRPSGVEGGPSLGRVMVDRSWIANPDSTVACPVEDDAMAPILPEGSLVAVDLSARHDVPPSGRIVVARAGGRNLVRWAELMDPVIALRPNRPADFPLIRLDADGPGRDAILGQVVWSWSPFSKG